MLLLVSRTVWFFYWITSTVILSTVILSLSFFLTVTSSFFHCYFLILVFSDIGLFRYCAFFHRVFFYSGFFLILWFSSYSTFFVCDFLWLINDVDFLWLIFFLCGFLLMRFSLIEFFVWFLWSISFVGFFDWVPLIFFTVIFPSPIFLSLIFLVWFYWLVFIFFDFVNFLNRCFWNYWKIL